jgi:SAM-dependent methyltransferase
MDPEAERLLQEADAQPFRGWDFSFLDGRVSEREPSWRYEDTVRYRRVYPLLDMGTGGGEFFSTLAPFEGLAVATETWPPNVPIAARNLRAVGGHVVWCDPAPDNAEWAGAGGDLPFRDETFALVINRHESFSPTEVFRVLRRGGSFITQQVGERDDEELHALYGSLDEPAHWGVEGWVQQLEGVGLEIIDAREEFPTKVFRDVGAVAWYMKAISPLGYFPGFTIDRSRDLLVRIHEMIKASGGLVVHDHRYFVEARRPA